MQGKSVFLRIFWSFSKFI